MTARDLDQQLVELRTAADAYEARHQFIPDLTWPEGVRIAVNFTCDFDAMLLRQLLNEPPMQLAKGEIGGRVGAWRLVELFNAQGVKATFFSLAESANSTLRR
jgi:peptidoglycan/xylan/chitin deacetylase (PgdA/CDA1 family)